MKNERTLTASEVSLILDKIINRDDWEEALKEVLSEEAKAKWLTILYTVVLYAIEDGNGCINIENYTKYSKIVAFYERELLKERQTDQNVIQKSDPFEKIRIKIVLNKAYLADTEGNTPLHLAASGLGARGKGEYESIPGIPHARKAPLVYIQPYLQEIEHLVAMGADVNAVNKEGYTPFNLASQNSHYEIMLLLLRQGAKLNEKDVVIPFLYQAAIDNNVTELVELLKKAGADDFKNAPGATVKLGDETLTVEQLQEMYEKQMRLSAAPPPKTFSPSVTNFWTSPVSHQKKKQSPPPTDESNIEPPPKVSRIETPQEKLLELIENTKENRESRVKTPREKLLEFIEETEDTLLLGNIYISLKEIMLSMSDYDEYYTADFINVLLSNSLINRDPIQVFPAIPLEKLPEYTSTITNSANSHMFIPLAITYNSVEKPNIKNHWVALIIQKTPNRRIFYLDPAGACVAPDEVRNILPGADDIVFNPIDFQQSEKQENWLRHCGVYMFEIFLYTTYKIRASIEIFPESLQSLLSGIPCGEASDIIHLRNGHREQVLRTLQKVFLKQNTMRVDDPHPHEPIVDDSHEYTAKQNNF